MATAEVGQKAPAFALRDQEGRTHRLKDYAGRPLVLYFYPKDDMPGCTREAYESRDTSAALLADEDHAVAERYGAWKEQILYGKTRLGIVRTTVLVDVDGRVARRWDGVKVDGHVASVLAAVQDLAGAR